MLELVTILLLATHLLSMNLASTGALLVAWLGWRDDEISSTAGHRLVKWTVTSFFAGILTGGLLIVMIPGDSLWNALERFPAKAYWFAAGELLFSLVCLLLIIWGRQRFHKGAIATLALISATNLLYHFPPMMAVIGKLAANPQMTSAEVIDRRDLLELMSRGEVLALSFHFAAAAVAVSAIAVLYLLSADAAVGTEEQGAVMRRAATIALVATLLQVPIGVWLLMSLPPTAQTALMGKNLGVSLSFLAAMVLSLILLQRLFAAAIGDVARGNLRIIAVLTCTVVLLMTASLRMSRPILLPPAATKTASSTDAQG